MGGSYSFKLEANKWVINIRWFLIIGITLISFIIGWKDFFLFRWSDLLNLNPQLILLLALALLFNALLLAIAGIIDKENSHRHVSWLSFLQMVVDIGLITAFIYDVSGVSNMLPALYFIPIVESVVLFGNFGPIIVSILIGLILDGLIIFSQSDFLRFLLGQPNDIRLENLNSITVFTWVLIFSALYLAVGYVSSYIAKEITRKEKMLEDSLAQDEVQINELHNFNLELEKDTRELQAKEFSLEMANKKLANLEQAKSKFVAVTAHQLRTPLSAIKWTMEMFMKDQLGPMNPEQKKFLTNGYASAERMIKIVNDLLHVDNLDGDLTDFNFTNVSLDPLLDSVLAEFANQAASKRIKLDLVKPPRRLPAIKADEDRLRIVLENLIDNAVKYTPTAGQVKVELSDAKLLNSAKPQIEILVSDSGIGIRDEDKSKIFTKFYRSQKAIEVEPDGTGIGLYLSKDIIEKHGGMLWYEANSTGGTIFHLTIPVSK